MRHEMLKTALVVWVLAHLFIVFGNIAAFFVVPFILPWYEWIPIESLIVVLSFSKVIDCPCTRLENYLRSELKMRPIGGFVGYYVVRPIKRLFRRMPFYVSMLNDVKIRRTGKSVRYTIDDAYVKVASSFSGII